jgi:Xaa-Pro aminopeptidase
MRAGVSAKQLVTEYMAFVDQEGFGQYLLYGPCHGLGIMEVEEPWMELSSEYNLETNMTFQVDTFLETPEFGLRYEDRVRVTATGVDAYSDQRLSIIELPA